jgi:hypothetical protein
VAALRVRTPTSAPGNTADPDATQVWRIRRLPFNSTSVKLANIRKAVRATISEREANEKTAGTTAR